MPIRFVLLTCGAAILALAGLLLVYGEYAEANREAWFALSVGVAIVVFASLPRALVSAHRGTAVLTVALLAAFVVIRVAPLGDGSEGWPAVVTLVVEALMLGVVLFFLRTHFGGMGRLIAALSQPPQQGGYARVLDREEAAGVIEVELARSRRRNEPLLFLVIDGRRCDGAEPLTTPARALAGASSIRYLEDLHLRARLGGLLSRHARRSDVVVRELDGRYLMLSPETDARGALALSERVRAAARTQLGMTLQIGIASFPDDGETLQDVVTVAALRAAAVPPAVVVVETSPSTAMPRKVVSR